MTIEVHKALAQYPEQAVQDFVESRGVQKIWDRFTEELDDHIREEMPFPEGLRTLSEDDIAQELVDYLIGRVIKEYGMGDVRLATSTDRKMR
jgi:hypothetical protein